MRPNNPYPTAEVLGISVNAIDMPLCLDHIADLFAQPGGHYICVAGVHGVMEAQRDPELFDAYRDAAMTVPDGMPLVWTGWLQNHPHMARVAGPDLMVEVLRDLRFRKLRHFLYGGAPGVAEELKVALQARFPAAEIAGTYTPPFRDLTEQELGDLEIQLADTRADILWIGISCPRQELFMARHVSRLPVRLMFGVGAAFDFHTGRIRDCSPLIKRAGLQWLHRLLQDPRRLWKRYLRNNPAFVYRISLQLLRDRFCTAAPVEVQREAKTRY
jgi:N-acetylglucosaminyldiphosphoundecaprenol N-acetyl-beta-D-mannosaminyltransferase